MAGGALSSSDGRKVFVISPVGPVTPLLESHSGLTRWQSFLGTFPHPKLGAEPDCQAESGNVCFSKVPKRC